MPKRALVVDANILLRAVLGRRVREIIETYAPTVSFFVPKAAFHEAERHLATLVIKHGGDTQKALEVLHSLIRIMDFIGPEIYGDFEAQARERLARRDPDDWPILAAGLALACPIWTEDKDFFGCGVAIWTSDRVVMFLRE